MKYSIIIVSVFLLFSCSSNKKSDPNVIVKELQLNSKYYIGTRASDNKSNIYTVDEKSNPSASDTIRHYLLNTWTDIQFWDVDGGYLLFKEYIKISSDGYKMSLSELDYLNDDYINGKEKEYLTRIEKEANEKNKQVVSQEINSKDELKSARRDEIVTKLIFAKKTADELGHKYSEAKNDIYGDERSILLKCNFILGEMKGLRNNLVNFHNNNISDFDGQLTGKFEGIMYTLENKISVYDYELKSVIN